MGAGRSLSVGASVGRQRRARAKDPHDTGTADAPTAPHPPKRPSRERRTSASLRRRAGSTADTPQMAYRRGLVAGYGVDSQGTTMLMGRSNTGEITEREWKDGRTITFGARLSAYDRRHRLGFGTNLQSWNRTRAEIGPEGAPQ